MKRLILIAAAALSLSACAAMPSVPASPGAVASTTMLDEQADTAVQLAYKGARLALELAVDTKKLTGANAARADVLNTKAYQLTVAVHTAYRAGNASDYAAALTQAQLAVAQLLAAIK